MNRENNLFSTYIKTKENSAFEELYQLTKPWLYRFIFRIIPSKDLADEILQETWIQLLSSIDNYDVTKGKVNNFLYTAAKNNALKSINKNQVFVHDNTDLESAEAVYGLNYKTPENIILTSEKYQLLMDAVLELDDNYRNAILLHYFDELDVKTIAEMLEKPENTIKTWLSRGREYLKKKLTKNDE
jgi:RNA polymerase sigma-70 factor (ECF subfamily)